MNTNQLKYNETTAKYIDVVWSQTQPRWLGRWWMCAFAIGECNLHAVEVEQNIHEKIFHLGIFTLFCLIKKGLH